MESTGRYRAAAPLMARPNAQVGVAVAAFSTNHP